MQLTSNEAAGPFSTQPSGPRPVGCFSALLARPVCVQIWALRSRLEKQPTDLRRCHHYMRNGTLIALAGHACGCTLIPMSLIFQVDAEGHPRPKISCDTCGNLIDMQSGGIAICDSQSAKPGALVEPVFQ